jgi:transposase-like protein
MDARGFPTSLPEFQQAFPNDTACAVYLEKLRWPDGFSCPKCGVCGEPYRFPKRSSVVLRCRSCKSNVSLTAGTSMQGTHTPLSIWFWGAYLVTTQTPGQSALQFQRQLGLGRYETAFQMLHKLRAGMVRPDRDAIGAEHPVEVDEALVGGRTRGEGYGVHHKAIVVGAVEVRTRRDGETPAAVGGVQHAMGKPLKRRTYAGRLRLRLVESRGADELLSFAQENVARGAVVRTDGWVGYNGLSAAGYNHEPLVMNDTPARNEQHMPMIHLVFSNLKTWLLGTHHGVSQDHLQAYLNEYVFRFNRRFYPMTAFNSVLGLAANTVPPTYEQLYSGEWQHAA